MAIYEQDIPELNLIVYEDDRWIEAITVKNEDGSSYSFSGATAELIVDATRPLTTSADLTLTSAGGDIVLTSGNVAIDAAHGLTANTDGTDKIYEYDFKITVSTKVTTLFRGKLRVRANV